MENVPLAIRQTAEWVSGKNDGFDHPRIKIRDEDGLDPYGIPHKVGLRRPKLERDPHIDKPMEERGLGKESI